MTATVTSINGEERPSRGVYLPQWFLVVAATAFISVSLTVIGVGLTTWFDVGEATRVNKEQEDRLDRQEVRIEHLEGLYADVATIKAKVDGISQDTIYTRGKIDALQDTLINEHNNNRR